ncbi:hypothetical protein QQ045_001423 [Rhodiola kirilowii]
MPLKMQDPGQFTIPCSIGATSFEHTLADLGASVSVMPLATYYELGLEGMRATKMAMQLVDGTTRKPKEFIENVPIKIDKFYFPCDFVVMDTGNKANTSLVFGRPFLATAGFKVDLGKGKLSLKIGGRSAEIESVGFRNVTKKDLYKLIDPDKDLSLDHKMLPSCYDGVKKKAKAKTAKREKQAPLWTRVIKKVACTSSKNPD